VAAQEVLSPGVGAGVPPLAGRAARGLLMPSLMQNMPLSPGAATIARGAAAGAAATIAMSGLMLAAKKAGVTGELPPEKITRKAMDGLDIPGGKDAVDVAASVAHLGYGMATGAAFALLRGSLLCDRPVSEGIAFAGLVWATSYFGWVPALGIMPPPTGDRPGRTITMIGAHALFGAVLGALTPRRARARRLPRARVQA
jgi:hypothetical protein